ncbi:hypothetical protein [uncultured Helicobacter sp.]|uniref:hypothetical protein n=1 Tax=uncultured Helicobacter sp. TaxID=175537 RepID=UPI00374EAF78
MSFSNCVILYSWNLGKFLSDLRVGFELAHTHRDNITQREMQGIADEGYALS